MFPYGKYHRPALKNGVDIQLQSAFNDSNWSSVVRLADKRFKTLRDPYYEAVKICAESQLDNSVDKCIAVSAVDNLVRKDAVIKDVDSLDLYEWACRERGRDLDYPQSHGVLRLRCVKANPRDSSVAVRCLRACIQQWDLVNAQQIAATLDKSFPKERKFFFWNITTTYLLSLSPQCPEEKRKIYGLLAMKQLDRAADMTEAASGTAEPAPSDRNIRSDEELSLYCRALKSHGSRDDYLRRMRSPRLGAVTKFDSGARNFLLEVLDECEKSGNWDDAYQLTYAVLSKTKADGTPDMRGCDWTIWKRLIMAASRQGDPLAASSQVEDLLKKYLTTPSKVNRLYARNLSLALTEFVFTFNENTASLAGSRNLTPKVAQLGSYIDEHHLKISVFDDLKSYVEQLSFSEAKDFVDNMLPRMAELGDNLKRISLRVLECKFRYLLLSCPLASTHQGSMGSGNEGASRFVCKFCTQSFERTCAVCHGKVATVALECYKEVDSDVALQARIPDLDKDPRADLALVASMACLKLAGLPQARPGCEGSPLRGVKTSRYLQAVNLLEHQLIETSDDTRLRIILFQLYLLMGCASQAYQLWAVMDIKRTILDALAPLFFDRIASLSPALFQSTSMPPMDPVKSYYSSSLRDKAPVKVWDAFEQASYSSIVDMADHSDRLRRSCTLVMSVVEERRAARALGRPVDNPITSVAHIGNVTDQTTLTIATDYGYMPDLESTLAPPVSDVLRLGPAFSNTRLHLGLLAEQYLDLVLFKQPKEYKSTKPNEAAARERDFVVESLERAHESLTTFLHIQDTPNLLTEGEHAYYTALSILAYLILVSLTAGRTEPLPPSFETCCSAATSILESLADNIRHDDPDSSTSPGTFSRLADGHAMSMARDTAAVVKHSAAFVKTFNEKEMQRDRTGKSNLHKDAVAEMKALEALAAKVLGEVKGRVKKLKTELNEGGWLDRLTEWTFGSVEVSEESDAEDGLSRLVYNVIGGSQGVEDWAGKALESWRETVNGWGMVKME